MEFRLRTPSAGFAELTIETNAETITEDISTYESHGRYIIDDSEIEKLITLVFEMHRFNLDSDVKLVKTIIGNFLNSSEQEEIAEYVSELVK